jgi:aspartate aminotransferase-like enzyme
MAPVSVFAYHGARLCRVQNPVILENHLSGLLPDVDPDGLLEFSVVFTDRSLNHMSKQFQQVMRDISATLKQVYQAAGVVVVPGGGTYGMEAVARQFATNQHVLVVRNGWFSYRWTQIFEAGSIPATATILKARRSTPGKTEPFAPAPIEEVVATIRKEKPAVVFAPHVETSAGMILPDDYIRQVADAVHEVGGLMVLDCIASGTIWVDMKATGVDLLISAPQKGWSSSPCSALVMMSERAMQKIGHTRSSSFANDLQQWLKIMHAYENGGHAYHATMPTDPLKKFRDTMVESSKIGFDKLKAEQQELGKAVRKLFAENGFQSVAAPGFEAPGVAVFYTDSDAMKTGAPFMQQGLQIAAGVPLQVDEGDDYKSFRIGLFGIDKLQNIDRTVGFLRDALANIKG